MPQHRSLSGVRPDPSGYKKIRSLTSELASPLSDADATLQSMEDASPAKWHLAHTTWFFETFLLVPFRPDYGLFNERYGYLFNSYYEGVGARHARPQRGLLSRPSLDEILDYRAHVDAAMNDSLHQGHLPTDLVVLGLHHEQQHQELLLTDILHAFAINPLHPAYRPPEPLAVEACEPDDAWTSFSGGDVTIGASGPDFAFDCERPAHRHYCAPFAMKNRAVTNGEWQAFMADGGYDNPLLWLSDGWAQRQNAQWSAPLYWEETPDGWSSMTLRGFQLLDENAPVCHISYYEADAFASWAGARLPTEQEWEVAAQAAPETLNDMSSERLRPAPQPPHPLGLSGLFGDVWEWTRSAFSPYPGFKVASGAVGEYNGKFMSGQMVLRGGSCVTPPGHLRTTYRNFFHPEKRWQFSGVRLAADA